MVGCGCGCSVCGEEVEVVGYSCGVCGEEIRRRLLWGFLGGVVVIMVRV